MQLLHVWNARWVEVQANFDFKMLRSEKNVKTFFFQIFQISLRIVKKI